MATKSHNFKYRVYASAEAAPAAYVELLKIAEKAMESAYAPYSEFLVGAALRLSDGTIIEGSNQENASFPQGICAERVALFAAGSRHPDMGADAIAIVTSQKFDSPASPCGGCRQVMSETENRFGQPMEVVLTDAAGRIYVFEKAADLLPFGFEGDFLKKPGRQ